LFVATVSFRRDAPFRKLGHHRFPFQKRFTQKKFAASRLRHFHPRQRLLRGQVGGHGDRGDDRGWRFTFFT
jgi:hypothetical protein